jgi:heme-degrading monooxygenase HmoA
MANRPITLLNVFTVNPSRQDELIGLLTEVTERFVSKAPGFIAARLHRGVDGTKVAMYAQWSSEEDYQAMRARLEPRRYFERALEFAQFEYGMYEVVRTFGPSETAAS